MKKKSKNAISVQTLTLGAMLTAVSIVLGIFCKNFLNFGGGLFRITFENFPIILSGILFGPLAGSLVGIAADVISYVLSTQTFAISPIVTLGAASVGAVSGLVSHHLLKKKDAKQILLSTALSHLVGSVIIKSIGLYVYYGAAVLFRIPLYFVIGSLEGSLIVMMSKNKNFQKYMEFGGEKR